MSGFDIDGIAGIARAAWLAESISLFKRIFGRYFLNMASKHSLLIGIETFIDPKIKTVGHAQKDADALALALQQLGYNENDQVVLINEKATRTNVEYNLKQILRCAHSDDNVLIFFSSHGYSDGSRTHLVCHDTRQGDMTGTSISLESVVSLMKASASKQIVLFLDCCHAGLKFPQGEKSLFSSMSYDEIQEFFATSEHRVGFASCKDSEKSYWSDVLGHGVWTHVLLQALTGKEKRLLEGNRYLRAASLQDYLAKTVPETLKNIFSERRIQTPVLFGSLTKNFLVADLGALLAKQVGEIGDDAFPIRDSAFRTSECGPIQSLSGFQKGHKVPNYRSSATECFVKQVGAPEVEEKVQNLYEQIKQAFGYLRKEISLETDGGSASIRAKDFDVNVELIQRVSDPTEYRLTTEVSNFSSAQIVHTDEFNEIFRGKVSSLRVEFQKDRNLTEFIDRVEESEGSDITIKNYPNDYSSCEFTVHGCPATFVLRSRCLDVNLPGKPPKAMVEALIKACKTLLLDAAAPKLLGE